MVVLPGVALAASRGFSQTPDAVSAPTISHKAVARYSRVKSAYKVPKSAAKQAKYISFLTTVLSLLPNQQAQAASIFAAASAADAELKQGMKSNRRSLSASVKSNDAAAMSKISSAIGSLAAQRHSNGANAHAAFLQLLTADQQAKLSQLTS
jgi:hypothetical protein